MTTESRGIILHILNIFIIQLNKDLVSSLSSYEYWVS